MNSNYSLRARWVLSMDGPALDGGVVSIANGRITSVGRGGEFPVQDLGDVVLMPGLINAHMHLEFSQLEQPLGTPGMPLSEWIRLVIADRKRSGRDASAAISQGMQESLRQGVTTLGEIATVAASAYATENVPQLVTFQEVIGFSAARTHSVLADLEERLENSPQNVRLGISPHAPYTVHPQLLEQLVNLAVKKNLPVAMHLAESPAELQLLTDNTGPFRDLLEERSMWDAEAIRKGSRPLDYLQVLARAPRALVIHGNYLETDEVSFLAEQRERMSVVYCSRTHAYFKHDPYPLQEMLAAGVQVVLGTDSRASNPDLSLFEELRFVFENFPSLTADKILSMGTLAAAQALGLADEVGSITVGKLANLTAVVCDANITNPAEAVLQSGGPPKLTSLRGRQFV